MATLKRLGTAVSEQDKLDIRTQLGIEADFEAIDNSLLSVNEDLVVIENKLDPLISNGITAIVKLTQVQYDAIVSPAATTLYIIVG